MAHFPNHPCFLSHCSCCDSQAFEIPGLQARPYHDDELQARILFTERRVNGKSFKSFTDQFFGAQWKNSRLKLAWDPIRNQVLAVKTVQEQSIATCLVCSGSSPGESPVKQRTSGFYQNNFLHQALCPEVSFEKSSMRGGLWNHRLGPSRGDWCHGSATRLAVAWQSGMERSKWCAVRIGLTKRFGSFWCFGGKLWVEPGTLIPSSFRTKLFRSTIPAFWWQRRTGVCLPSPYSPEIHFGKVGKRVTKFWVYLWHTYGLLWDWWQ